MNTHITSILPAKVNDKCEHEPTKIINVGYNQAIDDCAEAIERAVKEGRITINERT